MAIKGTAKQAELSATLGFFIGLASVSLFSVTAGQLQWVGGLGALGGFVIPPVLGIMVAANGHAGYVYGFYVFVALSALAIVLSLILMCAENGSMIPRRVLCLISI